MTARVAPVFKRFVILTIITACSPAARASERSAAWGGAVYAYSYAATLRDDSVLNPGNDIARLAQRSDTAEARFHFKAENERWRLTLRPIGIVQNDRNAFGGERHDDAYLSQWQVRLSVTDVWNASVGRDVLTWGPAQFRSPANPFYFDNARRDPLRELTGIDAVKLSWTPDVRTTVYVARLADYGHNRRNGEAWRDGSLIKADWRADEWAGGVALAKQPGRQVFAGAHLQQTLGDAWLLYGETGSYTRNDALLSPADAAQPFAIVDESARRTDFLLGAAYTLDNGQSLAVEYLRYGHGYHANETAAYFERAAASTQAAGLALTAAPPLLGRDYAHLVWQSSPLASDGYWRLMLTRNFNGGGSEAAAYGECTLTARISGFALAVAPVGDERQELSSVFSRSVTVGVKIGI